MNHPFRIRIPTASQTACQTASPDRTPYRASRARGRSFRLLLSVIGVGLGGIGGHGLATPRAGAAELPVRSTHERADQPATTPADIRRERARNRLRDNPVATERAADSPPPRPPIDPSLVAWYRATVTELSDPAYEGRSPGSAGIEKAAEHIEARFRELGLVPLFASSETAADGTEVLTPRSSFRQTFTVGQEVRAERAAMRIGGEALEPGADFSPLAYSGTGVAESGVVFCGYAIVTGPDGYLGFAPDANLAGRIALCLNLEPMDEQGRSLWMSDGFSNLSAMNYKAAALIRRGAAGVLIVTPPSAQSDRVGILETVDSTRQSRPGLNARAPKFDAPVLHITPAAAERIIAGAGDPEITLGSLTEASNRGAVFQALGDATVAIDVEMGTVERTAYNIGALLEGRGPLRDEYVVIGAHYDHVGFGGQGSLDPSAAGQLHPGADDNASGTSGMLLAAQLVREGMAALAPDSACRSFVFLAFSAEEMGLLGSIHYTKQPSVPLDDTVLMLNLDMIGRLEGDPLELGGLDSAPDLESLADPSIENSGLVVARDTSIGSGRSDHASFDAARVPNMFFFTGLHPQYHRPQDTADLIDAEGGVRVTLLCTAIAMDAATRAEPLVHVRRARADERAQDAPPKVRLGLLPTNSTKGGVLIRRVFPDTSASDAGLRPDDRIVTWNGEPLRSTEDMRPRLSAHEPGEVVVLGVERDGAMIDVSVTLRGIE